MKIILALALVACVGCGGDNLTADQRRAAEVALELVPAADRAEVERRAASWTAAQMAHIHKMARLKAERPDLWHAAQAQAERSINGPR